MSTQPAEPPDLKRLLEEAEADVKKSRARAAELAARPLPDLSPQPHLVAYIDILGFGNEIQRARTKKDLERAYKKLRLVQREFQTPSAVDEPAEQAALHSHYGRRVMALSDAIVIAITPSCPGRAHMASYDLLGFAMYELLLAQARCVALHGIFLRGAITHGSFFFEDDVLLSPALARAYELESRVAMNPVIVVPESTLDGLLSLPGKRAYHVDPDPVEHNFSRYGRRKWKNQDLYFLDYVSVMMDEDHGWSKADRERYHDAKKKHDAGRAQEILNSHAVKSAARFLRQHKHVVQKGFDAAPNDRVRKKYRWLMAYHNKCATTGRRHIENQRFDLD